jgi:hypothetical protein
MSCLGGNASAFATETGVIGHAGPTKFALLHDFAPPRRFFLAALILAHRRSSTSLDGEKGRHLFSQGEDIPALLI